MTLSDELRARIRNEFPKYPEKQAVALTALHFVQAEHGWIPPGAIREVAEILELKPIDLQEVASFYAMFHTEPVGRCHVQVCTNLSCALLGARGVMRALEEELGIQVGEVTEDGDFSLGEVECLGSCGTAPVVMVNNDAYRENVKASDVSTMLAELRSTIAGRPNPRATGSHGGEK